MKKTHFRSFNSDGQQCHLCNRNNFSKLHSTETLVDITCDSCKRIIYEGT